jgi:hypothetical protein
MHIQLNTGVITANWSVEWVLQFKSADELKAAVKDEAYPEGYFKQLFELAQAEGKPKKEKQVKGTADES